MLSDLVVCYLFLGGTGAGLCLVLSVLGLLVPRSCLSTLPGVHLHPSAAYRKLLGSGFVAAFVLLALGIVCLVADLGNAERMILLLVHPTASYLAVGSWALAACLALAAALGLAWLGVGVWNVALVRVVHVVAGLASLVVMVYTGLLLQSLGAVPLWATPWLPALFAASSLSCGIACALALAQITGAASAFGAMLGRPSMPRSSWSSRPSSRCSYARLRRQARRCRTAPSSPWRNRCGSWWRAGTRSCSGAASLCSAWRCRSRWTSCSHCGAARCQASFCSPPRACWPAGSSCGSASSRPARILF